MAPDGRAAVRIAGQRAEGIARLEGEVFLHRVDGGEVVVLDFAQFQKATSSVSSID